MKYTFTLLLLLIIFKIEAQFEIQEFVNNTNIDIAENGNSDPYPSLITVSDIPSFLSHIRVELFGIEHSFSTSQLDFLLESPDGQQFTIFSDIFLDSNSPLNDTIVLDFDSHRKIGDISPIPYDIYSPTNNGLTDEFPDLGAITNDPSFLDLQNINPNGDWKLYAVDDFISFDWASLMGWKLTIEASDSAICNRPEFLIDVISNNRNKIKVGWENTDNESWDIFYTNLDTLINYRTTQPIIEGLTGNEIEIVDLDYDQDYYIYYRKTCDTISSVPSRWVGPIEVRTGTGICAYAEYIDYCQQINVLTHTSYQNVFFDPCQETTTKQRMFNFTPPNDGNYYLNILNNPHNNLFSLSIRPQEEDVTYCDSLNWECISIDNDINDYLMGELHSDTTYKILLNSSSIIHFQISECPFPRDITLDEFIPHPYEVEFSFLKNEIPLEGNFDIYYTQDTIIPDINTIPTVSNYEFTDGYFLTPSLNLQSDTNYEMYLRGICQSGESCWIGPFDFHTDIECGIYVEDSILVDATATTAKITYLNTGPASMKILFRDSLFPMPAYDSLNYMDFINVIVDNESLQKGLFLYRLRANTTYHYYLKNDCGGLNYESQPWQGPFSFTTNSAPFIETPEIYCNQCYYVDTESIEFQNLNYSDETDLFPILQPTICSYEDFEPQLEEAFLFKATSNGIVTLQRGMSSSCDDSDFQVQFYYKSASLPFDFNDWNFIGCHLAEGIHTSGDVLNIEVEKDSIYYILADIYGDDCPGIATASLQFILKGDCENPCQPVDSLLSEELDDENIKVEWTYDDPNVGFEITDSRGEFLFIGDCTQGYKPLTQSNSVEINADSIVSKYSELDAVSMYVRAYCSEENYSGWQELSLTPEIKSTSIYSTDFSLGGCSPKYDRTTLSPLNQVPYDILPFALEEDGVYYFDNRISNSNHGSYFAIYETAFDSLNPSENLIFEIENESSTKQEYSLELSKDVNYFFIANAIVPADQQSIYFKVIGPEKLISDGFKFKGIEEDPHGIVHESDGLLYESNRVCVDKNGWRHYYYSDANNPNEEDYLLFSIENYPEISDDLNPFLASVGGNSTATLISNPPANYVDKVNGYYTMNRYWDVELHPFRQPSFPTGIRFYYTQSDLEGLKEVLSNDTLDHQDLYFNKINDENDLYDINPQNGHANIYGALNCAGEGIWEYENGNIADTTTWYLGTFENGFYAEYKVHSFSGGGGGIGTFKFPDQDGDGYSSTDDCDDLNQHVNPGLNEIPYDGIDNDCNPLTLDDDLDGDGFPLAEDCDDLNQDINPNVDEIIYDGLDNDCNPLTLDDDLDEDEFDVAEDCDDLNPEINPNIIEIPYDNIDNDCNPLTLDDDLDEDGFLLTEDCDDLNSAVNPNEIEIEYDGLDNDCNPLTPDDDLDGDGFVLEQDCDDLNPEINPSAEEIPNNGIDENCDGLDIVVSTNNLEINLLRVFPNPVLSNLILEPIQGSTHIYNIKLIDISGIILYESTFQFDIHEIDISHFQSGIYILEVLDLDNGEILIKKIVKK